ncbi:hypothetical protein ACFQV2_06690 [Actinokineospora soli]|uniref:Carbohydrate kinase PfkB domain-containing protein n=1 Tax=Actinokineospora soli TaxID=1048753 RepID=A0ABW2TI59_9PSEU
MAGRGPRVDGNPTGAGDAAVAALADGMARGTAWPDRLRAAVAWSAAAVAAPRRARSSRTCWASRSRSPSCDDAAPPGGGAASTRVSR